jgi:branched-subunit amino acid transport protein
MDSALSPTLVWTVIVGMALTNFAFRFLPMSVLSRMRLPDAFMRWLRFIPISVMGALFAQSILIPAFESTDRVALYLNPGIYGGLFAMLVFRLSKSFMVSSLAGMLVYVALRFILGL